MKLKNECLLSLILSMVPVVMAPCLADEMESPDAYKKLSYDEIRTTARGDYSKLSFNIKSNKGTYCVGEPIYVQTSVTNNSSGEVVVFGCETINYLSVNDIHDFHVRKKVDKIPLTVFGSNLLKGKKNANESKEGIPFSDRNFMVLKPGQTHILEIEQINAFFDMTDIAVYDLVYYRHTVAHQQRYDLPLKSNSLRIRIIPIMFTREKLLEQGEFGDNRNTRPPSPSKGQRDIYSPYFPTKENR